MNGHKELFICDQSYIKNQMRRWQVEIGQGKSIQCLKKLFNRFLTVSKLLTHSTKEGLFFTLVTGLAPLLEVSFSLSIRVERS